MSIPIALQSCSVIIAQPVHGKQENLRINNVPTIRGASYFSSSSRDLDSVVSLSTFPTRGASFGPHHRSVPGRELSERCRSPFRNEFELIINGHFLTSIGHQRGVNFSLRGIVPRSSSANSTVRRHRTIRGAAHVFHVFHVFQTFVFHVFLVIHRTIMAANSLEILVNPESFNKELLSEINILKEPYKRPFFLSNCHVETIFAAFYRSLPKLTFERECLKMADGGTVSVDWPIGGEDLEVWRGQLEQDVPVLILLPGLAGHSGDTYVRHMALEARRTGWRVAVFISRGCGDAPVTTSRFYAAAFTGDLRQVVKHVGSLYPSSRVYAAGWSLGANILVRYIGEEGDHCPLAGAVSLCNPFDMVLSSKEFEKGFNSIYDKNFASAMQKMLAKHASLFEGIGGDFNIPHAANAKTLRGVHEGLTIVSFGFKSVDEYYAKSSSSRDIKDIKIPLLCIQAADDPIAPPGVIPRADIKANSNCALVVSPAGGHLGWIAGRGSIFGAPWTDPLVMDYLNLLHKSLQTRTAFAKSRGHTGDLQLAGVETRETSGEQSTIADPLVR